MKVLILLCTFFVGSIAWGSGPLGPIYSLKKGSLLASSMNPSMVIHESENYWILKTSIMDIEARDYYFLQLDHKIVKKPWGDLPVEVVGYVPGEWAVIQIENREDLFTVSSQIHNMSGQCGAIQKLSNQTLVEDQSSPQPMLTGRNAQVEKIISKIGSQRILEDIKTMVSWGTRFEGDANGQLAGQKLKALYEVIVPEDRTDVEIQLVQHSGTQQNSVLVRIIGQTLPDEVVILGSHLDSINSGDNSNAPGADDNASGTATNLEVFRLLMENNIRPLKTIEIHGYAAEEIGLVGSGEMADDYKSRNVKVTAMVQFDMNGYSKNGKSKIYLVSNGTNKGLTKELGTLIDQYLEIPWGKQFLIFGSSDHASWKKRGFPVAFPTENPFAYNKSIHTGDDKIKNLNQPQQIAEFAKLGVAYLIHFSGI